MQGKSVSGVAAVIIATCAAISLATFGVYINSAPIISVSCPGPCGESCYCAATEDFGLWGTIQKYHWEQFVMLMALVVIAIYAVALIVERSLVFYSASRQSREFYSKVGEALFRGEFCRAAQLSRDYPSSPLAFVVRATFSEANSETTLKPSMYARHQAIVAQTLELKKGLWHLTAIGWSLVLLAVLAVCVGTITSARMVRYAETSYFPSASGMFADSLSTVVYCVLAGFAVLVAHRFFAAKVEHFQLEMERLSLAIIERVSAFSKSSEDGGDQPLPIAREDHSRTTRKLRGSSRLEVES